MSQTNKKGCRNEYYKQWYQENKERKSEYNKQWWLENKKRIAGYSKRWWQSHKEQARVTNKAWRDKVKLEVLAHYGRGKLVCVKCGFTDIGALSIDHVNGDGAAHRKVVHTSDFYQWLRKNNYPEGYQTLCMNCQWIKRDRDKIKNRQEKISGNNVYSERSV